VAVLSDDETPKSLINDSDFRVVWFSGTGNGGQYRNKHQNSCRVTHIPTGLCEIRQDRSRKSNLDSAKKALIEKINALNLNTHHNNISIERKNMIGSGQRGDKIRTIRMCDDVAIDHRNNNKIRASDYLNGKMYLLW
jgi:peptide chain release factor 1